MTQKKLPGPFISERHRRPTWRKGPVLTGILIAFGAAAFLAYLLFVKEPPEVKRGSEVTFRHDQGPKKRVLSRKVEWPFFGYDPQRTKYLPSSSVVPPFKEMWRISGRILIEFPPVYADGRLFLAKNNGAVFAIDALRGRRIWKKKLGSLNAATPAYHDGKVYIGMLSRQVAALDADTGKTVWSWRAASRVESSPVVVKDTLYFGSENGTLYAVNTENGKRRWTFHAGGALKGGPAFSNGKIFVGSYDGNVYAVNAKTGKKIWSNGEGGAFYSTPAVAFGRVYIGNTNGKVYSFSTLDGQIAWSQDSGAYIYAGPAVADIPKLGPTVYIGSYDSSFYALDAKTGSVRWRHQGASRISGAATVIGDVVYYATLDSHRTVGLDARNGKPRFHFRTGAFAAPVSDGRNLYITGYASLWGLEPKN